MPIAHLNRDQSIAFLSEITSTRNLLAYGTHVVRTAPFSDTTRDPILTMLSIGVEKLYKLTLGVAVLDSTHKWPTKADMVAYGHGVEAMHAAVMAELTTRTASSTPYVRGLLAGVQADPVIPPLIAALDRYGRKGRFFYLDLLGEDPQPWESPEGYWQEIENAVTDQPEIAALYTAAIADVSNSGLWDRAHQALNDRIADAILGLWEMISRSAINHVFGETGDLFGWEVRPGSVGRQLPD